MRDGESRIENRAIEICGDRERARAPMPEIESICIMRHLVTNRTFSPIQLTGIHLIPNTNSG